MWINKKNSYEYFLNQSTANGKIKNIANVAYNKSNISAKRAKIVRFQWDSQTNRGSPE